jgi:hypothetical protein
MDKINYELKRMLLDIAYSFGDGSFLPFIEFAKLTIAVLDSAVEPEQVLESTKADVVYELWKDYAAGRRKPSTGR